MLVWLGTPLACNIISGPLCYWPKVHPNIIFIKVCLISKLLAEKIILNKID
jgi:hypothetical protein